MRLIIFFIILFPLSALSTTSEDGYLKFVNHERLQLSHSEHIIGEHMINIMKLTEKGYINLEVLSKVIRETEKSKNFSNFLSWLKAVEEIVKTTSMNDLIIKCQKYTTKVETLPLERVLEKVAGNFCREKTLEAIGRDIEKKNRISEEAVQFIQQNLKFYLTKKNKKNFAYFLQSQSNRPEILKKLSQEVTTYSVSHDVIPAQEVLKDIVISEEITKLIQNKGFNPLQNQNVFYAEFGKLIESGYRTLDSKPSEDKVKEHYEFLKNYLELNNDHLPTGLCLTRLNDFAKAVFRNGFKDLSRDIFKFIIKKNNKEILEDAQFFHLWTYLFENDYKEALKIADKYNLIDKYEKAQDPRLKFWIAYSLEKTGENSNAVEIYEHIIQNHPLSYFGIMSTKKLQALKPTSQVINYYANKSSDPSSKLNVDFKEFDEDYLSSLIRLKAWARIDSQRMMKLELKRLNLHSMPNQIVKYSSDRQLDARSDLHLLNAKIIQESKNYLATFRYLYDVLDKKEVNFNRALLETLYPRPYYEDLVKILKNESLDPIVVLALIRQESVFNPLAQSRVGARGLMQLMPATARRFKKSLRDKHLANPSLNLELGTKYFKGLLKRYDGNLVYVLSAYNAGESRVERWKNVYFDSDETIIKNIEAIPFLETRNYVKLIFRNIFFYKLLSEQKELADSRDANRIFDVTLGFNH
ncbi:MAG: transglycosylase SLT domain-containing protein [Bacteriovoracaceae bacterium]